MLPLLLMSLNVTHSASYSNILNLSDLTESATKVISGKVISMSPHKKPNGKIYTTVKIAVDKTYVGAKTTHYSFDVLGGTINGESLTVSGSPQFNIGKSALIFAENSKVVGFAQGAFEIKGNAAVRGFGVNIKKRPK